MSDNDKKAQEELNNLEEEAYFELCQIIAEAIALQDIRVLNSRLASWKIKYKKLLDGSTPNSLLIQKIKRLQSDQYIGYIIDLIMRQITIKEHVKIQNQAKALRKLYSIIKETDDLKTLEEKVSEWQKKYPIESFLRMYKKKVKLQTSQENLEENAFDQDKAFYDLVQITKINGSFEELSQELEKWEKEYSIHDKFELDDFIKNQSDVKRYTSQEYLLSISNEQDQLEDEKPDEIIKSNSNPSSLTKQANAYASLLAISSMPNNIDKIFEWVYKNNKIVFNDEYKQLILSATYLDYSPTYLKKLKTPDINILSSSLSYEEYVNINSIKRYAVISYFNLLLPPEKRVDNNFFNKYLRQIHDKSDKLKHQKLQIKIEQKEEEPKVEITPTIEQKPLTPKKEDIVVPVVEHVDSIPKEAIDHEDSVPVEIENTIPVVESVKPDEPAKLDIEITKESDITVPAPVNEDINSKEDEPKEEVTSTMEQENQDHKDDEITISVVDSDTQEISTDSFESIGTTIELTVSPDVPEVTQTTTFETTIEPEADLEPEKSVTVSQEVQVSDDTEDVLDEEQEIIVYSPVFFDTVYNYSKQAELIDKIDSSLSKKGAKTQKQDVLDLDIEIQKSDEN